MKIRPAPLLTALLLALLLMTGKPCPAAEPERLSVAVVEFNVIGNLGTEGGGAIVAEWLVSALGESDFYALRERVLLKEVLSEQQLTLSGLVAEKEHATRIGKLYGLDAVISGSVFRWGDTITVTARLIDSQTGSIRHTAEICAADLAGVPARIPDLARILTGQANQAEIDGQRPGALVPTAVRSSKMELGSATWTEPLTGLEFVLLKGGCYLMGQSEQEKKYLIQEYGAQDYAKLYADEFPQHEVCVDDFWLARRETSNRQYRLFRPEHSSLDYRGRSLNDDNQPAVYVSWEDARAFAAWLSAQYQDRIFRLPTEAEWEKGCRAGTETPRFWGWDSDEACHFANVHDRGAEKENHFGWPPHDCDDGFVVTAPVGSLAPNPAGLHDMLGNVWEWTEDVFQADGYREHSRNNPVITDGGTTRVRRGGCWNNEDGDIRCTNRSAREGNRQNNRDGFRLLMQPRTPGLKEVADPKNTPRPRVEIPLAPGQKSYAFKFSNATPTSYAVVISSPLPAREKEPDYRGIALAVKVFAGDRLLLGKTSPAIARFADPALGEYGAFFVTYHAPSELPVGQDLAATVEISGDLGEFLARRGASKLAVIPAPE